MGKLEDCVKQLKLFAIAQQQEEARAAVTAATTAASGASHTRDPIHAAAWHLLHAATRPGSNPMTRGGGASAASAAAADARSAVADVVAATERKQRCEGESLACAVPVGDFTVELEALKAAAAALVAREPQQEAQLAQQEEDRAPLEARQEAQQEAQQLLLHFSRRRDARRRRGGGETRGGKQSNDAQGQTAEERGGTPGGAHGGADACREAQGAKEAHAKGDSRRWVSGRLRYVSAMYTRLIYECHSVRHSVRRVYFPLVCRVCHWLQRAADSRQYALW